MTIYAIENADGELVSFGYDSSREARDDAQVSTNNGRARSFDSVEEMRKQYPDSWLDKYSDEEILEEDR